MLSYVTKMITIVFQRLFFSAAFNDLRHWLLRVSKLDAQQQQQQQQQQQSFVVSTTTTTSTTATAIIRRLDNNNNNTSQIQRFLMTTQNQEYARTILHPHFQM